MHFPAKKSALENSHSNHQFEASYLFIRTYMLHIRKCAIVIAPINWHEMVHDKFEKKRRKRFSSIFTIRLSLGSNYLARTLKYPQPLAFSNGVRSHEVCIDHLIATHIRPLVPEYEHL